MRREIAAGLVVLSTSLILAGEAPPVQKPRTFEPDPVPAVNAEGRPVRTINDQGFRVELDLSQQVISAEIHERFDWRQDAGRAEPGDTVTVIADAVSLRLGNATVAPLTRGQTLVVTKVEGDWLQSSVLDRGQKRTGWISRSQAKLVGREDPVLPSLAGVVQGKFVSGAVLLQKSKQFDDGLYAAVELAAQAGAGKFGGKQKLLRTLVETLDMQPPTRASAVVASAAKLGGYSSRVSAALQAAAQREADEFLANPLRSKPLGFYTWSPSLASIFQQDRMLQTDLTADDGLKQLVAALQAQPEVRETYERYLQLTARLTNPSRHQDLRPLLAANGTSTDSAGSGPFRIFPPSTSHENELVMKLYGDKPIPDGFDLMDELIARVRAGDIDLTPRPESGWYDHQTWSLEPLIRPEQAAEADHLHMDDRYKKRLVDLFKGALALARETHVKQMEVPPPAAAAPPEQVKEIFIGLELSAEPLVTHYRRRAAAYRFIRTVLEEAFGREALASLHRQTPTGLVNQPLGEELQWMESLFAGAAATTGRQLGLSEMPADGSSDVASAVFLKWAANLAIDPDLSRDSRMMVPVFYDVMRKQTKVWVFLGWSQQDVWFGVRRNPSFRILDAQGMEVENGKGVEVHFNGRNQAMAYPVMAELYVSRLLNRDEFRRHCDTYLTRSAILENLR